MFELEDYSSGYHDGFLNKYADSCGPTLDMYMTDSLQDMLDIDIRSEIATVVGGTNELASLVNDLPSSLDHAIEAISSINNNGASTSSNSHGLLHASSCSSSAWMGTGLSWSSSNDFYADVGACVNPISVMPLISSSLLHKSPKVSLNANSLRSTSGSPPPASPNASETKSHLTFSPAQMKVSANAIRNEQLLSHIPKQIVAISSTVTAATTAPATMATNSALQRKNSAAVESIKKDLGIELRKVTPISNQTKLSASILNSNSLLHGVASSATTNTIKLAPGIGGLTFANTITYNKLKQQSAAKSPQGSPVTANGTIVLKRDRDASPLHNMTTLTANGQHVTKILARNLVQTTTSYTPKSIASAHSPLMQSANSPLSSGSSTSHSPAAAGNTHNGNGSFSVGGLTSISASSLVHHVSASSTTVSSTSNTATITSMAAVKPLQQKIKAAVVESEYPKPAYSYSCLIAMALKNSRSGSLPVSEIYSFMCEHFPYFKTAPSGWKNSVRHNLSLNKCFEKIEKPATNGNQRKGCLWAMNPERIAKMDEEVQKWSRKDPMAIRNAMVFPEHLEALERGEMKHGSSGDSDVELDSQSEIEETSDLELEQELDDAIVDNMFVEEDIEEEDDDMSVGGMLNSGIVVLSAADGDGGGGGDADGVTLQQPHRDFDIEVSLETHTIEKAAAAASSMLYEKVEDIYDAIDLEDDKDAVQMAISQGDIIELSPADLNTPVHHTISSSSSCSSSSSGYQSPKRARLNINYSIGPAGELEKHIQIQQQKQPQHQQQPPQLHLHQGTIKQIKVLQQQPHHHNHHHHQQQQHQLQHKPQHIVVQTITNGSSTTTTTIQAASQQHFQQITAIPNHNRRKMQLVSRIA